MVLGFIVLLAQRHSDYASRVTISSPDTLEPEVDQSLVRGVND